MSVVVKGTAHLFGVSGTMSNATVLSFRDKDGAANEGQTKDESGNVIERRYDDITVEATIGIRIRTSYTKPTIGSVLTYNSVSYEVTSVEKNETQDGFREMTLNLKKSEYVTYA